MPYKTLIQATVWLILDWYKCSQITGKKISIWFDQFVYTSFYKSCKRQFFVNWFKPALSKHCANDICGNRPLKCFNRQLVKCHLLGDKPKEETFFNFDLTTTWAAKLVALEKQLRTQNATVLQMTGLKKYSRYFDTSGI